MRSRRKEDHPGFNMKRSAVIFVFSFLSVFSYSQNQSFAHLCLKRVQQQQTSADPHFLRWAFPAYVSKSRHYSEAQADNNVFFNALIGYTLKSLRSELSPADQLVVDSIA